MRIILLGLILLISGCGPADSNTKIVRAKHEAIEQRLIMIGKIPFRKEVKVYYIYATDGTYVEVRKEDFVGVIIGDWFFAHYWSKL